MYEPQQPDDIDINKVGSGNQEIQSQNIVERAQAENLSVKNVVSRQNQLQGLFTKLIIFGLGLGVIVAIGVVIALQKFGLALGLFFVGMALESAGFIEATAGEALPEQPLSALNAIRWAIGPIPTVCLVAGIALTLFYPITRPVHDDIKLKLLQRKNAAKNQKSES